jgi:hypothetical protein
MEISMMGYGENTATFEALEGVAPGMPVKMAGNGTVGPSSAGDAFCGVAVNVRGGFAAVQLSGYVTLPYTGEAPAPGFALLNAAGAGAVQKDAAGRSLLVIDADDSAKTCGILL